MTMNPNGNSRILPIRLVCATRESRERFLSHTATGRSVKSFIGISKVEVRLYAENKVGLSELYNDAIEEARFHPAILVFIHDDVLITDFFWADRVREGLNLFDIVGLVGNARRIPNQPSWCIIDLDTFRLDDSIHLSGAIGQGQGFPPPKLDIFGASLQKCKLLDGVFLACKSSTLVATGLRFDAELAFHFYDLAFCRLAEKLDLTMGTIPISVVHQSYGSLDDKWQEAYKKYISKWGE